MKVIHEEAGLSQGHGLREVGRLAAGGGSAGCGDAPVIHSAARGGPECLSGLGGSIKFGGRPVLARPDFHASSPERCEEGVRGAGRVQVVDGLSLRAFPRTRTCPNALSAQSGREEVLHTARSCTSPSATPEVHKDGPFRVSGSG